MVFDRDDIIAEIKERLNRPEGIWRYVEAELELSAEDCDINEVYSVTFNPSPAISGNVHDYFSEGPYWWPNPENPQGEYIWRDGECNPDLFENHKKDFTKMFDRTAVLAYAGFYFDREDYIKKAAELIKVWFVDEKTKMNPHLEYAQAIRRKCDGRSIGIIDFIHIISVINSAAFISRNGLCDDVINGFRAWLADFLVWLQTSKNGIQEKNHGNNHSMWYTAIVMTIAAFLDKKDVIEENAEFYKTDLIPKQLNDKSEFTEEITRTKSFTYSIFNLDAAAIICEIAGNFGVDLWSHEKDGRGIKSAAENLIPYMKNPYKWPYVQFNGMIPECSLGLELTGLRLGVIEALEANDIRSSGKRYVRKLHPLGFFSLLFGRINE